MAWLALGQPGGFGMNGPVSSVEDGIDDVSNVDGPEGCYTLYQWNLKILQTTPSATRS